MMEIEEQINIEQKNIKKTKTKKSQGEGSDAKRVALRLQSFNISESPAFKKISARFPSGISHSELKRMAEILAENLNLRLDRDAKRDNRVLIKWYDENWCILYNEIDRIQAYDEDYNLIQ